MLEIIQQLDEGILFFIQEYMKNPILDRLMVFITSLGNAGFLWILVAFLLLCQKRSQKIGIPFLCAIALAMVLSDEVFKHLFSRIRPNIKFSDIPLLIPRMSTPSFPSGHTTVGFAAAATIYHYNPRVGSASLTLAAMIAFSRLYLFVHYPTDVLGGILLGLATSYLVVYGVERLYSHLPNPQKKQNPKPRY